MLKANVTGRIYEVVGENQVGLCVWVKNQVRKAAVYVWPRRLQVIVGSKDCFLTGSEVRRPPGHVFVGLLFDIRANGRTENVYARDEGSVPCPGFTAAKSAEMDDVTPLGKDRCYFKERCYMTVMIEPWQFSSRFVWFLTSIGVAASTDDD